MALTDKQLDELVEEILSGKQERFLEEMTNSAIERFEKAAQGLGGSQTAEAQLEQLARDWPAEAKRILAKYSPQISDEVATSVELTLTDSYKEDEKAMQAFIASGVEAAAGVASLYAAGATTEAFSRRAAQAAQGVASIIRRQNILMEEAAEKLWYEACEEAVNRAVLGTMPEKEIIAKGVEKMGDIGKVTYGRNGKKTVSNFVDVAIRRHVRTQTAQAGARMTIDLLNSYGHDLVITDSHWGARPSHAEWQGKPCCMKGRKEVDGVEYPDIRDLTGYGTVTGLLGANCQHSINPYYPGITPLPDRDFKKLEKHYGMTSDEYYEATQQQRAWERRIRQTKRDIAVMEQGGIGLESPTYVQKRLVLGRQQKSIAKLCEEKKLPRQYAREKAYGVAKQPRALKTKSNTFNTVKPKATNKPKPIETTKTANPITKPIEKTIESNNKHIFNEANYKHYDPVNDVKDWIPKLNKPEMDAIQEYTSNEYKYINAYNRRLYDWVEDGENWKILNDKNLVEKAKSTPELTQQEGEKFFDFMRRKKADPLNKAREVIKAQERVERQNKCLDSAIEKYSLNEDIKVYRKVRPDAFDTDDISSLIGEEYTDKTFISSSIAKDNKFGGGGDVTMEMFIPKGTGRGMYIEDLTLVSGELEFLIARNSSFRIIDVKLRGEETIVKMELIV